MPAEPFQNRGASKKGQRGRTPCFWSGSVGLPFKRQSLPSSGTDVKLTLWIINSISMSVSARLKQYGAFRAIGVSMGQLSKMIVAEAFTYTIIGGVVGTVLGLFCNKLLFGMLISYRWGDAWTPPLPEVAVILLIVVSSVILAVHGPIKRIRNMSIVDTISAQ